MLEKQTSWRKYEEYTSSILNDEVVKKYLEKHLSLKDFKIQPKEKLPGKSGTNWQVDAYGDDINELTQCRIVGMKIQGSATSGRGFWGRIFGSQCEMNDVYINGGSIGIQLDDCYASKYYNVWVRSTISHGIFVNNISHNTTFIGCKVQLILQPRRQH